QTYNTVHRNSACEVFQYEPHTDANAGGQSEKRQANIIIIETCGDLNSSQRLKAVRLENFQIRRVAEQSKRGQTIQWSDQPQDRENEAKQCACPGEAAIYWRGYDVERGRENNGDYAISNEADWRERKLCFVR